MEIVITSVPHASREILLLLRFFSSWRSSKLSWKKHCILSLWQQHYARPNQYSQVDHSTTDQTTDGLQLSQ